MIAEIARRLRQTGLARAVARRSLADWPLVLAAWLLLACATSLITSAAAYSESVSTGGFRRMLVTTPPSETAVRIHASVVSAQIEATDAAVSPVIGAVLSPGLGSDSMVATTDGLAIAGTSDTAHQISVGAYVGIESHAVLVSGRWGKAGASPVEATLSEGGAKALGLSVGDTVTVVSMLDPKVETRLVIVGIWQPTASDRYWLGSPLELAGTVTNGAATTRGPFVVPLADLTAMAGPANLDLEWRWLPAIESLRPDEVDGLRAALTALPGRVQGAVPQDTYTVVDSGLPDSLAAAARSLLVTQSSVLLLFAQFAVLAVYAILLVAGMLVERRRPESALLRSRGASAWHLALLAAGEATLLAVPAAIVAPFVALLVVPLIGTIGPLATAGVIAPVAIGGTAIAAAAIAGLGCIVALTLPALPSFGSLSGVRAALSRQVGRTLAQRLGLDLILALVAALAIWQLRLYGAPLTRTVQGELGLDPLLVAAPAIGLLAGAIVATRIVPRLGEIAERLTGGGRGLAAPTFARQFGRRPLRYTRAAMLLMLAASLGTFAAVYAATWSRSEDAQASYRAAADVRLTSTDHLGGPSWALGPALRGIDGVTAAVPVTRRTMDVGYGVRGGELLAVDPAAAATMVSFPPDTFSAGAGAGSAGGAAPTGVTTASSEAAAGPSAAGPAATEPAATEPAAAAMALIDYSPPTAAALLAGNPVRIAVTFDSSLASTGITPGQADPNAADTQIGVAVVVSNSDGLFRFESGSQGVLVGNGQRIEVPLTAAGSGKAVAPQGPLRLEAVELHVAGPDQTELQGGLTLTSVQVSDSAAGSDWQVAIAPGAAGWAWGRVDDNAAAPVAAVAGDPGRLDIGDQPGQAAPIVLSAPNLDDITLRYWAPPTAELTLPAIAGTSLIDASGAGIGDTVVASLSGYEVKLRIAGTAAGFPPLDPATPFAVVDRAALGLVGYADWGTIAAAQEWWLSVEPSRDVAVTATLGGAQYSAATVISEPQLADALHSDPIALGAIGALALGSIAAFAIAGIGFLTTVAFLARERLGELALFRALGESSRGVTGVLFAEQVALLIYGLIAGGLLGLLIGWLVIPFAALTPTGLPAVPSPELIVPWTAMAPIGAVTLAILAIGGGVLVRVASAMPLADTLRRHGE